MHATVFVWIRGYSVHKYTTGTTASHCLQEAFVKAERGPEASFPTGWSACCICKCSQKGPLLSCLPRLIFFVFLLSGVLVSTYWYLYVVLTLISIITSNANKHLFKYLLAIWILSFVRCLCVFCFLFVANVKYNCFIMTCSIHLLILTAFRFFWIFYILLEIFYRQWAGAVEHLCAEGLHALVPCVKGLKWLWLCFIYFI